MMPIQSANFKGWKRKDLYDTWIRRGLNPYISAFSEDVLYDEQFSNQKGCWRKRFTGSECECDSLTRTEGIRLRYSNFHAMMITFSSSTCKEATANVTILYTVRSHILSEGVACEGTTRDKIGTLSYPNLINGNTVTHVFCINSCFIFLLYSSQK